MSRSRNPNKKFKIEIMETNFPGISNGRSPAWCLKGDTISVDPRPWAPEVSIKKPGNANSFKFNIISFTGPVSVGKQFHLYRFELETGGDEWLLEIVRQTLHGDKPPNVPQFSVTYAFEAYHDSVHSNHASGSGGGWNR